MFEASLLALGLALLWLGAGDTDRRWFLIAIGGPLALISGALMSGVRVF